MHVPQRQPESSGSRHPESGTWSVPPPPVQLPARPNQVYYSEVAPGVWRGPFDFQIRDFRRFFREGVNADKAISLILHAACRARNRVFIDSAFRCPPGSKSARALARVSLKLGFPLPDLGVYDLRVAYQLDPDGIQATGVLEENLGPVPHRRAKQPVQATISAAGLRAEYQREGFGTTWQGVYTVSPCRNHVSVHYQSSWGDIRYEAQRIQSPPVGGGKRRDGDPLVAAAIERLQALSLRLAQTAIALSEGDLVLPFLDTYTSATDALIDALRFGMSVPSTRSYDQEIRYFADPTWVAKLGEAFGNRFLDALTGYRCSGRCTEGWQGVFQALKGRPMTEIDALALCIYAHIALDLPFALAQSAAHPLDSHIEDYDLVNRVLAADIETLQQQIAGRYGVQYAWLDALAGKYDEVFVGQLIQEARARAWYFATRLHAASAKKDLDRLEEVERFLVRSVNFFIDALLAPRPAPLTVAARLSRSLLARARRWAQTGELR